MKVLSYSKLRDKLGTKKNHFVPFARQKEPKFIQKHGFTPRVELFWENAAIFSV